MYLFQVPVRSQEPSDRVLEWVSERLSTSNSDAVRARAALTLAFWGDLPAIDAATLVDTVNGAARPDAVLALAFAADDDDAILKAVERDGPLSRWTAALAERDQVDEALGSL